MPIPFAESFTPREKRLALDFDYDGCLANGAFHTAYWRIKTKFNDDILGLLPNDLTVSRLRMVINNILHSIINYPTQNLRAYLVFELEKIFDLQYQYFIKDSSPELNASFQTLKEKLIPQIAEKAYQRQIDSEKALIDTNQNLLAYIYKRIKNNNYTAIHVFSNSSRQDRMQDYQNSAKGWSFHALTLLCKELGKHCNIPVIEERILTADIVGDKSAGENFTNALEEENTYNYDSSFHDISKVSTTYVHTHKLRHEHPDTEFDYLFFDNLTSILTDQTKYYADGTMFPLAINAEYLAYEGGEITCHTKIRGCGVVDAHYRDSYKLMITAHGYNVKSIGSEDSSLNFPYSHMLEPSIDFKINRLQDPKQIIEMLDVYIERLKYSSNQYSVALGEFEQQLQFLSNHISYEYLNQKSRHYTQEQMLQSPEINVAKETIRMLLWWKQKALIQKGDISVVDTTRSNRLKNYSSNCGWRSDALVAMRAMTVLNNTYLKALQFGFVTSAWSYLVKLFNFKPLQTTLAWFRGASNNLLFKSTDNVLFVNNVQHALNTLLDEDKKSETKSP